MERDTEKFHYSIDLQESLYSGFYKMDQLTIRHQRFDGNELTIKREMMDRLDAVCILLVDFNREELVFVEQFRAGALRESNPWLIELVAGLIDKDESPEDVARREAQEEAGVSIGRIEPIMRYLPSPGGTNERIHLFVGEVNANTAHGIHGLDEEGEDIRVLTTSFAEAFRWVEEGRINNAAAIIGLQWLQLNESALRARWA
jgi:ADP-ribose pyrophosphatase